MLGWHISVYRKMDARASPAMTESSEGVLLAVWRIDWLDELVKAGKAIDLGGKGYPSCAIRRPPSTLPPAHGGTTESSQDLAARSGRYRHGEVGMEDRDRPCRRRRLRPDGSTPTIRSHNGSIFTSRRFWAARHDHRRRQEFITPYMPEQNGMVDRFFRSLTEACVCQHNFAGYGKARMAISYWIRRYSEHRVHEALGHLGHISAVPSHFYSRWLEMGEVLHRPYLDARDIRLLNRRIRNRRDRGPMVAARYRPPDGSIHLSWALISRLEAGLRPLDLAANEIPTPL
jgi:Integrase core domain